MLWIQVAQIQGWKAVAFPFQERRMDASAPSPVHVPGMTDWKEILGQTQDILRGQHFPQ